MRRFVVLLFLSLLLGACNTELQTPGEKLDIKVDTLPEAYIGEEFVANVQAVGGLAPYNFTLAKGTLPPGLSLQGGTIRGTPTEEGSFEFTITVSDANLSEVFRDYTLSVTTPPPAELTLNTPLTEIQRTVTLRAEIKEARSLQAFRTQIEWDESLFEYVPDSLRSYNDAFGIFEQLEEGRLNVDVAILGGSLNGNRRIFEFQLRPIEPSLLGFNISTEFLGATGLHDYTNLTEGNFVSEEPVDETLPPEENPNPENNGDGGNGDA